MKSLFPPDPRSSSSDLKGLGNGSSNNLPSLALQQPQDADVSMDDSHASAMSGVTTESMTIGSPPRTQRRKRSSIGFRSIAGPTLSESKTAPDAGVSVRSRLFSDDADLKQHDNSNNNNNNHHTRDNNDDNSISNTILKPYDLNQEFADNSSSSRAHDSPPTRGRNGTPSTLTPFRPRLSGKAAMALRKRQADQDDLYGRDWGCDASSNDMQDAFSAAESPVDMYTSPRISPATPSSKNSGSNGGKSTNRIALHRSPFYSKQHLLQQNQGGRQQQLQYHKSPSHFQTLDGRTVQSKNPFSPMIFDETPTPTPSKPLPPGNSPAPGTNGQGAAANLGLTHPLLLTADFPTSSRNEDNAAAGGKSHLVLRHKLQKRESSPCNTNGVGRSVNSPNKLTARNGGRMNHMMDMGALFRDGLIPAERSTTDNIDKNDTINSNSNNIIHNKNHQLEQKASMYTRDGHPEQSGPYSFTGSPIKENFATATTKAAAHAPVYDEASSKNLSGVLDAKAFPASGNRSEKSPQQQQDFCTNIHKIRRRSKGDDVVAAAAQGESSWKKDMFIVTNNCGGNDNTTNDVPLINFNNLSGSLYYNQRNQQQISKTQKEDSISPTDVFNYPQFRASPSDSSTLPPAPSKPIRRPPVRRYTPIRKTTGPPPTPMPGARQSRPFDFEEANNHRHNNNNSFDASDIDGVDSSDDEKGDDRISNAQRRRRRRRPLSGPDSDAQETTTALPPSRFYSDFDVIAELGSGSFGNVFKALSRLDGCFYAIKVAHRVAKGIGDKERMLKEVYALAALSDRSDTATFHIVRYHQAWMEEERLYIQTELCTTTLQAEMQMAAPRQLPLATRYKCLREILLALTFIHNNQMVHLDIKPENIFVSTTDYFTLCVCNQQYVVSHTFYLFLIID